MKLWCPKGRDGLRWDFMRDSKMGVIRALSRERYGCSFIENDTAMREWARNEEFTIVPVSLTEIKPKRKAKR